MRGPLAGVRVLDLTRLLPGGYATMLLADLGADVVKVERPDDGDGTRTIPPVVEGHGALHRALNRGKRSVALDLKSDAGADALRRLVDRADVLIESFRPGVMERLGLGYPSLAERAPALLYVAITGYGRSGPDRDRAGHDINYIGQAGILGVAAGPPVLPGVQIADLAGGMAAAVTLLAHLPEARRTGTGRLLDISLLDAAVSWLWALPTHLAEDAATQGGRELTGELACYRVYAAADGALLTVGALEPLFWANLCEALGAPELVEGQYGPPERQAAIAARLAALFATRPRDAWLEDLAGLDVCVGPVHDLPGVAADPQVRDRRMLAEVEGRAVGPSSPLGPGPRAAGPAPALGQHTEEVLAEAGLGPEEIAALV